MTSTPSQRVWGCFNLRFVVCSFRTLAGKAFRTISRTCSSQEPASLTSTQRGHLHRQADTVSISYHAADMSTSPIELPPFVHSPLAIDALLDRQWSVLETKVSMLDADIEFDAPSYV